jgi:hypothetical protein
VTRHQAPEGRQILDYDAGATPEPFWQSVRRDGYGILVFLLSELVLGAGVLALWWRWGMND